MRTLFSSIANSNESSEQFVLKCTGVGTTQSISSATHLSNLLFVTTSSDHLNELITITEQSISTTNDIDVNDKQTNCSNNSDISTRPYQQGKSKRAG